MEKSCQFKTGNIPLFKFDIKMRLTLICLLVPLFGMQASNSHAQKVVTLNHNKTTVSHLLDEIESDTDYRFVYKVDDVDLDRDVSIDVKDEKVPEVLDEIFKDTDVNYDLLDSQIFLNKLMPRHVSSQQEDVEIEGTVINAETEEPILGANVIEKADSTNGTSTNEDGEFSITVPMDATFQISYVASKTEEIDVGSLSLDDFKNLVVELEPKKSSLEEAVVVGYGKQSKISMTGSISETEPEKLRTSTTALSPNLMGNVSGVLGVQRTGEPSVDGADFFIRGISSYSGATEPLIILDGVEISKNDMDKLTPEIIESVSVLKDASATAVYGNEGANGVVLITTKTGEAMEEAEINARVQTTVSTPTKTPDFVGGIDYMKLFNEAVTNRETGENLYTQEKIEGTAKNKNKYIFPNVNWYDELLKKASFGQEANINVRGGGEKVQYFLSATFNHQTGLLRNDSRNSYKNNVDTKDYDLQNNIDAQITPTTKVSLKLNTKLNFYNGAAAGSPGIYDAIMNTNPVDFPKFYPSDSIQDGRDLNYGGKTGGFGGEGFDNPYGELTKGYRDDFEVLNTASLRGEQKLDFITEGLTFKARVSLKNWARKTTLRERGYNRYELGEYKKLEDGTYDYKINRVGDFQDLTLHTETGHQGDRVVTIQPSFQYNRAFGKHDIGGLFLYKLREFRDNQPGDLISSLPERRLDLVGRVTYRYDDRYLFEANFAYNGSENFAKGHRFGFFPSLSVGYVISNEDWFDSNVITYLKPKLSWGRVGEDDIGGGRFPYISDIGLHDRGYTTGRDLDNDYSGPEYHKFENRDITWEISDKWNIGLEANLFDGLNFNVDYFHENTKNIFDDISDTNPDYFGTAGVNVFANFGRVVNRGIDFSIDFDKEINEDFSFTAKGTFSYAHNTIKVNNEPPFTDKPHLSSVGRPIGTPQGYIAERLFIDKADVKNNPKQQLGGEEVVAGDIKYRDVTGDGKVDSDDRTFMGHPANPEITYGLSASVYYKNWDLSFLLQGVAKTSFFINNFHPFGDQGIRNVLEWVANDRYRPTNPDIYAGYPKLSKKDQKNNTENSSYWLRDGSFLKLRSAEIGYTYKNFRLFLSGFNLFVISKFNKWDPEEGGGSGLSYPTLRKFTVGIQLDF